MALDQATIGQVVTGQMEALERDYGDDEGVEIGAVITIVEVLKQDGERVSSNVRMRHNVGDPYRALGIVRAAEQTVLEGFGEG
ncbi:MAG TPA: hypothetical protein VN772_01650 [Solirubrobacteraceae bacterium]|nr:hypothetical protein [Solirubrobacteraceae bacterium]